MYINKYSKKTLIFSFPFSISSSSTSFLLSLLQTNRILSTISEQSQLLSPKKLLALQRQTSLYSPLPPRSPGTVETPGNSLENLSFSDSAADISSAKGNSVVPAMSVGANALLKRIFYYYSALSYSAFFKTSRVNFSFLLYIGYCFQLTLLHE